jgi:spore germination cell wall hydrolase CwlJ-like protein
MIRNIKLLVVALLLSVTTAYADESVAIAETNVDVIQAIANKTQDTIGLIVRTVTTPLIGVKDIQCLARNIFYEAGNQPEEGMVAVGLVTLNRADDPNYPSSVCGVVHQRTVLETPKHVTKMVTTKVGYFGRTETHKETQTIWTKVTVCQFSWACTTVRTPKENDPRWVESMRVAQALAYGEYDDWREKYANAMHFHAVALHPGWKLKKISKVGGHIFYE